MNSRTLLGISSVLSVGIFPLIGITAMLFFLPTEFWNFLKQKFAIASGTGVKIYYDDDCGFCLRTARLIKTFMEDLRKRPLLQPVYARYLCRD